MYIVKSLACLLIRIIESANAMYHPMDTHHAIYESCADAVARGGIKPNPNEPITLLLSDGTNTSCGTKRVNNGPETFCPPGMYGIQSKCFAVHNQYVTNLEASRYVFRRNISCSKSFFFQTRIQNITQNNFENIQNLL